MNMVVSNVIAETNSFVRIEIVTFIDSEIVCKVRYAMTIQQVLHVV